MSVSSAAAAFIASSFFATSEKEREKVPIEACLVEMTATVRVDARRMHADMTEYGGVGCYFGAFQPQTA